MEAVLKHVKKMPNGCWLWQASRDKFGYGRLVLNKRTWLAHRASYHFARGPIPKGLTLDHLCRNRGCVNPDHLEAVPHKENVLRGRSFAAKNAAKTHCKNGHPFNQSNTYRFNGKHRLCRQCNAEAVARYKAKKQRTAP